MNFIATTSFGNRVFINTNYIESVFEIDGKTRIVTLSAEEFYETTESIEEIMQKIKEVNR